MKKTYNINLNGRSFCIDEDAFYQLQEYIDTLEKHYLTEEDGKEIMADIESRIAELLCEFLQRSHREVVSQTEIEQVIGIMGRPDVIIDGDRQESTSTSQPIKRKFYRCSEYAMLGGVASGIGAYFDISRAIIRLIFILLTVFGYGSALIAYILLWIVVPKAVTSRQKMEMRGVRINVSNIEKNVRDTYNDVKKNSKLKGTFLQVEEWFRRFFNALGQLINRLGTIVLTLLAIGGLIMGTLGFLGLCWGICTVEWYVPEQHILLLGYASSPIALGVLKLLIILVLCLPLGLVAYLSASYLFKFRGGRGAVVLTAGTIGMLSCIGGVSAFFFYYSKYARYSYSETSLYPTACRESHQLTVDFNNLPLQKQDTKSWSSRHCDDYVLGTPLFAKDSVKRLYLQPYIRFRPAQDSVPQIVIRYKARGASRNEAVANSGNIEYKYELRNDTLKMDSYFTLNSPKWRVNKVDITVFLPETYRLNLKNVPQSGISSTTFKNSRKFLHNPRQEQSYVMLKEQLQEVE